MRLKDFEVAAIRETVSQFDRAAKIYLFGSRADDSKRGGDIDLLILSKTIGDNEKSQIRIILYEKIGEQKIDVVITPEIITAFHRIALATGVEIMNTEEQTTGTQKQSEDIKKDYTANLLVELANFNRSLYWLKRSFRICGQIGLKERYEEEEFDNIEALTSRFARTSDILIQKVFRSIDKMELEKDGTLIDTLNRAEKRGIIDSIDDIRAIRDLRNDISHNYLTDDLIMLYKKVLTQLEPLFKIANRVNTYCQKYRPTTT